jgi:hypothetical protein
MIQNCNPVGTLKVERKVPEGVPAGVLGEKCSKYAILKGKLANVLESFM